MSNKNANRRDPVRTTIVGGQPQVNTKAAQGVPDGIERLISRAATDQRFREQLLTDREAAVRYARIRLTGNEKVILLSIPDAQLAKIIATARPTEAPRRGFLRWAVGGIAALLGGSTLVTGGCPTMGIQPDEPPVTGIRPDIPPAGAFPVEGSRPDIPPAGEAMSKGIRPDIPPDDASDESATGDDADPPTDEPVNEDDPESPSDQATRGIRPDVPPDRE